MPRLAHARRRRDCMQQDGDRDEVRKEQGGWEDDSRPDGGAGRRMGGGPGRGGRMRF